MHPQCRHRRHQHRSHLGCHPDRCPSSQSSMMPSRSQSSSQSSGMPLVLQSLSSNSQESRMPLLLQSRMMNSNWKVPKPWVCLSLGKPMPLTNNDLQSRPLSQVFNTQRIRTLQIPSLSRTTARWLTKTIRQRMVIHSIHQYLEHSVSTSGTDNVWMNKFILEGFSGHAMPSSQVSEIALCGSTSRIFVILEGTSVHFHLHSDPSK